MENSECSLPLIENELLFHLHMRSQAPEGEKTVENEGQSALAVRTSVFDECGLVWVTNAGKNMLF